MKLCSACLCGINCRWNGKNRLNDKILAMVARGGVLPVCPEQLAGLPTPREACEGPIDGRVISKSGRDFTDEFTRGAVKVLELARAVGATEFIGTESPSCSVGKIYDGKFSGGFVPGNGITAALLKENGIKITNVADII
ncbi:MAG: DUF523 domain-containing protein [Alphaproteobacteria bacterium]|nr:DUF523 domain-containing protein [Alphaproteobacteria bacterium]